MKVKFLSAVASVAAIILMVVAGSGPGHIRVAQAAVPVGCWNSVASPIVGFGGRLSAVEVVSANDIWTVGYFVPDGGDHQTFTIHWNGTAWSPIPSPNPGPFYNELNAVSAVSSNDVWAVGNTYDWNNGQEQTLALHWDGIQWSVVPTPNVGPDRDVLLSVSAISANDVWAVGYSGDLDVYSRPTDTFTLGMHWNGTAWQVVPTPNDPRPNENHWNQLSSVDAVGTNEVWAVGYGVPGGTSLSFIERWDGSTWSVVPSPLTPDEGLQGVDVRSANDVWAVGGSSFSTRIEHWDGVAWSEQQPEPFPYPGIGILYSVSAQAANDVWAVGEDSVGSSPIIVHWDGMQWSQVPASFPGFHLSGVAVVTTNSVWAVGYSATSGQEDPLVMRYSDPCPGSITPTVTATASSTRTLTSTPTDTVTRTPTETPTDTPVPPTRTPTDTPTNTPSRTHTATPTDTATNTHTATPTDTALPSTNTPLPTTTATAQASSTSVMSTDVPKSISDGGTTTSELTFGGGSGGQGFSIFSPESGNEIIANVEVIGIDISEPAAADLDVYLISPAGSMVELFTDVCSGNAWNSGNTGFNLSDGAPALIGSQCPPRRNSYRPEGLLSRFVGQSPEGTWRLLVTDDRAGGGAGSLNGWGLRITTAPGPGPCNTCTLSVESVSISCNTNGTVHWIATVRNSTVCSVSNIPWGADLEIRRGNNQNYVPVRAQSGTRSFPPGATTITGDFCYPFPADATAMRARFGMVDRNRQCVPNGVSASRPVCDTQPVCPQ